MELYLGCFANRSDVEGEFRVTLDDNVNILVASYDMPPYEGYAYVLFEQNGKLYEVHGSHCSCYGLEDMWEPEQTTVESIKHRLKNGNLSDYYGGNEAEVLAALQRITRTKLFRQAK